MKTQSFASWRSALTVGLLCLAANAATAQTYYYWVSPNPFTVRAKPESFVVALTESQASQADALLSQGVRANFEGHIAAGTVSYNVNYDAPGHPVWNWYVATVDQIYDPRTAGFLACECPSLIFSPSDIAADPSGWISKNGDGINSEFYSITGRIDTNKPDAMANVSNRGLTGSGESSLITGFIVTGGQPRHIVVRALGPSLASTGVQHFATNPRIDVFEGSTKVAVNADWKSDFRASQLSQSYAALMPSNEKEAALLLALMPGSYTIVATNEDGTSGVVLVEAYDVDVVQWGNV